MPSQGLDPSGAYYQLRAAQAFRGDARDAWYVEHAPLIAWATRVVNAACKAALRRTMGINMAGKVLLDATIAPFPRMPSAVREVVDAPAPSRRARNLYTFPDDEAFE